MFLRQPPRQAPRGGNGRSHGRQLAGSELAPRVAAGDDASRVGGYIADWLDAADAAERKHLLHGKPDPECALCRGTGTYLSTYNPRAKWDSWRIGGRWDGAVAGRRRRSGGGFNLGRQHEELSGNVVPVARLPRGLTCFAIVTPDGDWHQEGELGAWGVAWNVDADWPRKVRLLLEARRDCLAVGCDLHV